MPRIENVIIFEHSRAPASYRSALSLELGIVSVTRTLTGSGRSPINVAAADAKVIRTLLAVESSTASEQSDREDEWVHFDDS